MLWIERPSGRDISDQRVELTIKDENGLRAATIVVDLGIVTNIEEVRIRVDRPVGETSRVVVEL